LHAVQDSTAIQIGSTTIDLKLVSAAAAGVRAPTLFEFRDRHSDPDKWPFRVQTGIYPPAAAALNTHTTEPRQLAAHLEGAPILPASRSARKPRIIVLARRRHSATSLPTFAHQQSLLMPYALNFTGMFWDMHGQYHVLEKLAGRYRFG